MTFDQAAGRIADETERLDAAKRSALKIAAEKSVRASIADLTILCVSLALGGSDEWTDAATMDAYVIGLAKERANEVIELRAAAGAERQIADEHAMKSNELRAKYHGLVESHDALVGMLIKLLQAIEDKEPLQRAIDETQKTLLGLAKGGPK